METLDNINGLKIRLVNAKTEQEAFRYAYALVHMINFKLKAIKVP